jgi:uncharacterized membrane protein
MTNPTSKERLKLVRLERVMDVVYALVIWRIFMILPRPSEDESESISVLDLVINDWDTFVIGLLALVIVIIFWLQNNSLFACLKATDRIHTAITIFQLFFLLFFLYSIGIGLRLGAGADSRMLESFAALLLAVSAYLGWYYAYRKGNLVSDDVSVAKAEELLKRNQAEPVTALITMPFAFVGPIAWELSWFLYPFIRWIFGRRAKQHGETWPGDM